MGYNSGIVGSASTIDAAANNGQLRQEYYDKKAIIDVKDEMILGQLSGTMAQPKNMGKEVVKHRYLPLLDDANAGGVSAGLDSAGVVYDNGNLYGSSRGTGFIEGKLPDLTEDAGRVNKVSFSRKEVRGNIVNRGFFYEWTKDEVDFDSDPMMKQHVTTEAVRGAAQINEDVLAIELINGAGVVYHAGTGIDTANTASNAFAAGAYTAGDIVNYEGKVYVAKATFTATATFDADDWLYQGIYEAAITDVSDLSAINFTSVPTIQDLIRIDTELDNNKCPKDTKVITGSRLTDTKTVAAARYMFISPDMKMDFMSVKALNGTDDAFVPVEQYAASSRDNKYITAIPGEIGKVGPFRIVVHPKMVRYSDANGEAIGHAWADTDGTANEGALFRHSNSKYEVYPNLVVGSEAFTHIGFEFGAGTKQKFKVVNKTPEELRSKENPYGKTGMTVIEWWNGVLIERPEWIAVYNTASKY